MRAGYAGRRLTRLQRERVLEQAVAGAPFDALREAAVTAGFPTAAGELIAELRRSLVTPERFAQAMSLWARQDRRREAYARDVAEHLPCLRGGSRANRSSRRRGLTRGVALDALRAAPGRWGNEPVLFYGFDDLDPLERDAIETLARAVGTTSPSR